MECVVDAPFELQELVHPVPVNIPNSKQGQQPTTTTATNAHDRFRHRLRGRAECIELFCGAAGLSLALSHRGSKTSTFDTDVGGEKPPVIPVAADLCCCSVLAALIDTIQGGRMI